MPSKAKVEEETYEVEKLVDMKMEGKKKMFLVKWKGYASKDNSWEPTSNLKDFKDEMAELEKALAGKEDVAPKKGSKRKEPEKPTSVAPPPERKAAKEARVASARSLEEEKAAPKKAKTSPSPASGGTLKWNIVSIAAKLKEELQAMNRSKEAKKPRRQKRETEVTEVDKILAVKSNAKGVLVYQILWMDGSKSWEPEDNVMDDDLVDEFEAVRSPERSNSAAAGHCCRHYDRLPPPLL